MDVINECPMLKVKMETFFLYRKLKKTINKINDICLTTNIKYYILISIIVVLVNIYALYKS